VYFEDRYALLLLAWAAGRERSVRRLRASPLSPLLSKPAVRRAIASAGDATLRAETLRARRAERFQIYRLGFGQWGSADARCWQPTYHQTTRPGLNLVLQLNFTREHNRAYYALIQPGTDHPYACSSHPIADKQLTMAWVRIDLELDAGEALIEEVQSDWIKYALWAKSALEQHVSNLEAGSYTGVHPSLVLAYVDSVLAPHAETWAEAALSAAIELLRGALGIRRIFFNSFETGCFLKGLKEGRPPRWIYSTLPRKFCFRRTFERPRALSRCKDPRVRDKLGRQWLEWFLLELP
jgi:hypothetical protein